VVGVVADHPGVGVVFRIGGECDPLAGAVVGVAPAPHVGARVSADGLDRIRVRDGDVTVVDERQVRDRMIGTNAVRDRLWIEVSHSPTPPEIAVAVYSVLCQHTTLLLCLATALRLGGGRCPTDTSR
jgi:hypothetical protein